MASHSTKIGCIKCGGHRWWGKTQLCRKCWNAEHSVWTADRHAELVRLYEAGNLTISQIAERMGLTKNQVVGRLHRNDMLLGGAVTSTLWTRMQAEHDRMDDVLDKCKLPRWQMYEPAPSH